LFVLIGFALLPQAGIEDDEALNVSGVYAHGFIAHAVEIFGLRIPIMLMSYYGALKSWIYAPIFEFWTPSPTSLRTPVILAGGFTLWLFYRLLLRIAGYPAATIGCLLLSVDPIFLLTSCFDWGPVVLQHLLTVSGVLCLVRFYQESRRRFLAVGFFLFGLALWDKALFAWILSGMAISVLFIFPKELRKLLSVRNVAVAMLAFCLGAGPLIFYNVCFPLNTFHSNATYSTDHLPEKTRNLVSALNGSALFGYLARTDPGERPRNPRGTIEQVSVRTTEIVGHFRSGFFGYALLAALLLTPWLWSTRARRPILFSIVTMLVAWLQMFFTKGAGASAHHVILLWPFPTLVVAVAFAEASSMLGRAGKPLLVVVLLILVGTSALVTNEYFASLVRNGGGLVWTDAIYPLSDFLKRVNSKVIYVNDWGMFGTLLMLGEGNLPLRGGSDPLSKPHLDMVDKRVVLDRISERGAVFVGHSDGNELFKGVNANLRALAAEAGYRREILAELADRNGRGIFEVFRYAPSADCCK